LNLLGWREPGVYGTVGLDEINAPMKKVAVGMICGLGWRSYLYGVQSLIAILQERAEAGAKTSGA
jgi:3-dehydroquinate dehydratase